MNKIALCIALSAALTGAAFAQDTKTAQPTRAQPATAQPVTAQPVTAQPAAKPATPAPTATKQPTETEKAWVAAGTPNENHALMQPLVGGWDAAVKYWDPTGKEIESTGRMVNTFTLGGRYLVSAFTSLGELAPGQKTRFEGACTMAYDNLQKKFVSAWTDNMSTEIMMTTGVYDAPAKTFTMTGTRTNPENGQTISTREVTVLNSGDKHTMTTFEKSSDGKERKVMEIVYTRMTGPTKEAAPLKPITKPDSKDEKKPSGN